MIEAVKIEVITEIGTLKFEKHFNSTADFAQAMWNFVSNNWRLLGDTKFNMFLKFPDGDITQTLFEGINATANLSESLENL